MYHSRYDSKNRTEFRVGRASDHLTDGTAVFIVRDMRCKYRTGQIVPLWGTPAEYDYLLLCDGSQISAELYPELVKVLGGNTLPDLVGRFLEGAGSAGEYKEAGLPNITGEKFWAGVSTNPANSKGALSGKIEVSGYTWLEHGYSGYTLLLDASKSNPIYGSSTTVQPNSMTVKYYICYAG